jgi:hypothetical protein
VKLLLALALAAAAACTLLDDDPPKNSCKTDMDCFRAQGETCDLQKHVCVQGPRDAGIDGP